MNTYAAPLSAPPYPQTAAGGAGSRVAGADYWGRRFVLLIVLTWVAGAGIGFRPALTMLTLVGFAAAVAGLRAPIVGLLGVGMLCTLDTVTRVFVMSGGILRWNTFNYWLLLVMLFSTTLLLRVKDVHSRLLQAFLVLLFVEILYSAGLMGGAMHFMNIVILFGLLIYFARAGADDDVWYWLGLSSGLLAALGGLVFFLQRSGLPKIDTNALAYFFITAIFTICLAFPFAANRRGGQLLLGTLAASNLFWVFLTGSRGGLLVALLCAFFLLTEIRGVGNRVILLAAAICLGFAALAQFTDLQDKTVHRIEKMFDPTRSAVSRTSGRSDLTVGAWRIFQRHPLGVGTGGFAHAWLELDDREGLSSFAQNREFPSHSAWMKTLAENGIPGVLLFGAYLFSFAVVGWQRRAQGLLVIGLLASTVLSLAFISTEFQGKGLWFLAAGATVLLHREAFTALVRPSRRQLLSEVLRPEVVGRERFQRATRHVDCGISILEV